MPFEVYVITNKENEKQYVGVTTKGYENRFKQHKLFARKRHKTSALYSAINKYGEDAFCVDLIADCASFDEMNAAEVHFIEKMNTLSPNGYNLTSGGDAGVFSDELKAKCSLVRAGEKPHENTVKAITALWADPERKEEQRKLISKGMAKSERSKAAQEKQKGRPKTKEHIAALRKAKAKPVECLSNGMIFDAIVDAVKWLNSIGFEKASHSKIIRACKSEEYTAYGYKWKRIE
jgi:group I intron endonuclease